MLPLKDGRAIKLTTARYLTPSGHSIQAQGIKPDIVVERAQIKPIDQGQSILEANLAGHLKNENGDDGKTPGPISSNTEDNQLYEALNVLKGINILRR